MGHNGLDNVCQNEAYWKKQKLHFGFYKVSTRLLHTCEEILSLSFSS